MKPGRGTQTHANMREEAPSCAAEALRLLEDNGLGPRAETNARAAPIDNEKETNIRGASERAAPDKGMTRMDKMTGWAKW